ncbi:MAG: hypothetical protein F2555_02005 [Actinobacteria bacterium]|jgi:hypothetical protein|uniref:Unannotated protein n=1 Tax=freshwater metagenome TaxID=449393 RepID=A0A6J6DRN3_9ZZZZ|nr:hypothetical protein [Actinomycetota bacterium]
MGKIAFWIIVVAAAAILISGKVRLAKRYEREDKTIKDVSSWRSLDRGVDPTDNEEDSK